MHNRYSRIPTIAFVFGVITVAAVPFVFPPVSTTNGLIKWFVWLLAILGIVYVTVTFVRIRRQSGTKAAIRWLFTGTVPANDS